MATEPAKPGSDTKTVSQPDPGSGGRLRKLKKAIDRLIGQPEQAREEAPIGWDFGPDGNPLWADRTAGGHVPDSTPPQSVDISSRLEKSPDEDFEDGGKTTADGRSGLDARLASGVDNGDAGQIPRPGTSDYIRGSSVNPLDPGIGVPPHPQRPGPSGPDIGHPGSGGGGGGGSGLQPGGPGEQGPAVPGPGTAGIRGRWQRTCDAACLSADGRRRRCGICH